MWSASYSWIASIPGQGVGLGLPCSFTLRCVFACSRQALDRRVHPGSALGKESGLSARPLSEAEGPALAPSDLPWVHESGRGPGLLARALELARANRSDSPAILLDWSRVSSVGVVVPPRTFKLVRDPRSSCVRTTLDRQIYLIRL